MWKSVCCAIQGTGHKKGDVPCQDKTFQLEQDGVHVIALADGAGSAHLSHYGAERVVEDVAQYIAEHFQEFVAEEDGNRVKQAILQMLLESLAEEAEWRECDIRDLASTLLLAAANEDRFILAHIGDGVIGYLDGDQLKIASAPDNGEFSNETTFVTSRDALAAMRIYKGELKNKAAFVLMSDGTEQSLYHKQSRTLASGVTKLMQRAILIGRGVLEEQLQAALESVISKNTQDDCSIAILARPAGILRPIVALAPEERQELYGIRPSERRAARRVKCYDTILANATTPCSLKQLAPKIHLRRKYARKRVARLVLRGLLIKKGNLYKAHS